MSKKPLTKAQLKRNAKILRISSIIFFVIGVILLIPCFPFAIFCFFWAWVCYYAPIANKTNKKPKTRSQNKTSPPKFGGMVYVNKGSKVYHSDINCRAIKGRHTTTYKSIAELKGLKPCKWCEPNQFGQPTYANFNNSNKTITQPNIESKKEEPQIKTPIKVLSPKDYIEEHHEIAGVFYHLDDIMTLAEESTYYTTSKSIISEFNLTNECLYEYDFPSKPVELVPEPDNPYDKNAIKVLLKGVCVGYIKKGSTAHIHNLLKNNRIKNMTLEIKGGRYKYWESKYDYMTDEETITLNKGEHDYEAILTIYVYKE